MSNPRSSRSKQPQFKNISIKCFTLPVNTGCVIPGCKREKEIASWYAYIPSHAYKPQRQLIKSESFYHSTKAPLQVFMATTHDSLLFQPEGDNGSWSCGPFTVVKNFRKSTSIGKKWWNQICWMSGSISSRELQLEAVGRHGSIIRSCWLSVESTSCQEYG